jgi:hypothetical protein
MKVLKLFILILFLLTGRFEIKAQWIQINFPEKYVAQQILSFKETLYVPAFAKLSVDTSGIFRSTDKGNSWSRIRNISSSFYTKVIAFPVGATDYIFAATDSGIYCTSDYGQTWIGKNNTLGKTQVSNIIQIDGVIYAIKYLHTYRSADLGESWQEIFYNAKNRGTGAIIKKGNFLLATMVDGTSDFLFKSTDNGLMWSSYGGYLYGANTMAIVGNTIYAGSYTVLQKSADDGLNWSAVTGLPSGYNYLYLKAFRDYLFCVHLTGVYFQHKDSTIWHNTSNGLMPGFFSTGEVDENYIYTAAQEGKIWRRPLSEVITSIEDQNNLFAGFTLLQNYPNPFARKTEIKWRTSEYCQVELRLYDFTGREIKTLVDENEAPGKHQVTFNAAGLPPGVYFYQLKANGKGETKKMIVSR